MKLIYGIDAKPKFGQLIVFAIQQLLAIMAATLVVPINVSAAVADLGLENPNMSPAAALVGAGAGTLVYVLFTLRKSPVFLGSSFAFIPSMIAAFTGATTSVALGYLGLVIGAAMAGLVYVVLAIIVKFAGTKWIDKLMPAVVIGPTVSIIGLGLAGSAVGQLQSANAGGDYRIAILVGLVTLAVTMLFSVYGKKFGKLIPFILGILSGYLFATVLTVIGNVANIDAIKIIDYSAFTNLLTDGKVTINTFVSLPDFTFLKAFGAFNGLSGSYIATIATAYVPVAFVVFAEHLADHKNISSIIEKDLLKEPGLHRTLLGDGIGSIAGALFGGAPNTTYGESIACVAITGNASVATIITAAILAIAIAFINPFVAFVNTIPLCVMGGVCMALYGFIAVSGLKMVQKVDLGDNRNLFVVSVILIAGIGGLAVSFGSVNITTVACALILGVLTNLMLSGKKSK
ncbi:MAG: uracil-xanthine permease [Clostridia bacterium]|nr:uracil-xanthine permease [Clostridia bacterium]